jgi:hypothetical protein
VAIYTFENLQLHDALCICNKVAGGGANRTA